VGQDGFEPPTLGSSVPRSANWSYCPFLLSIVTPKITIAMLIKNIPTIKFIDINTISSKKQKKNKSFNKFTIMFNVFHF